LATDTLNIIIKSKADGKGADEAKKGLGGIEKAAKFAAGAFAALKLAQGAVDFVAFGAGVQRQATALDNLTQSAGTSGSAVVAAIQNASDFTIDRMTAMSAASKALIMDVAKTPDEFERLTKVATALGRAMGQDAAKSIDDFVTAAARQSKQIADNLGLVVGAGAANEQYAKKLGKAADALTDAEKKQAFLNAMLTAGEEKLTALGDTSGGAATKIEKLKAAVNDAKAGLAEMAAETFDAAVDVDELAKRFRELPQTVSKMGQLANWAIEAGDALLHGKNAADAFQAAIRRDYLASEEFLQTVKAMPPAVDGWYVAMQGASGAVGDTTRSAEDLQFALRKVYGDLSLTKDEFNAAVDPAGELMYQSDELAASLEAMAAASAESQAKLDALKSATSEMALAAQNAALAQMDLAEKLLDASAAEVAQAGISQLRAALDEGKITFDQYQSAVTETQLAFGLATPESIMLSANVTALTGALADGKVGADDYSEALTAIVAQSQAGVTSTSLLGDALNSLPADIPINVRINQVGGLPNLPAGIELLQHGTPWFRGGMALVGERGPELAMLPRGAQVLNARQTARAMGGNITNIFNINAAGMDARELADVINRHQRLGGMRRPTAVG